MIGAERTEGIEFRYHIAKYPLQKDYINPQLNKRYLTHFSIINRIKRYIFAKILSTKTIFMKRLVRNNTLRVGLIVDNKDLHFIAWDLVKEA